MYCHCWPHSFFGSRQIQTHNARVQGVELLTVGASRRVQGGGTLHLFACAAVQSMHSCCWIEKHSHPSQSIVVLGRKSFQGIGCVGACGGLDFLCKVELCQGWRSISCFWELSVPLWNSWGCVVPRLRKHSSYDAKATVTGWWQDALGHGYRRRHRQRVLEREYERQKARCNQCIAVWFNTCAEMVLSIHRRKFRSLTSDNMDSWKAE